MFRKKSTPKLANAMQSLTEGKPYAAIRIIRKLLAGKTEYAPSDSHGLQQLALAILKPWVVVWRKRQLVDKLFGQAKELAEQEDKPNLRLAQLYRDWAEALRKFRQASAARHFIEQSLHYLSQAQEQDEVEATDYTHEQGATLGHLSRIVYTLGDTSRANSLAECTDSLLRTHELFWLNALVWHIKINPDITVIVPGESAPIPGHEVAMRLARATNNRKRQIQIRLLHWRLTRPFFTP